MQVDPNGAEVFSIVSMLDDPSFFLGLGLGLIIGFLLNSVGSSKITPEGETPNNLKMITNANNDPRVQRFFIAIATLFLVFALDWETVLKSDTFLIEGFDRGIATIGYILGLFAGLLIATACQVALLFSRTRGHRKQADQIGGSIRALTVSDVVGEYLQSGFSGAQLALTTRTQEIEKDEAAALLYDSRNEFIQFQRIVVKLQKSLAQNLPLTRNSKLDEANFRERFSIFLTELTSLMEQLFIPAEDNDRWISATLMVYAKKQEITPTLADRLMQQADFVGNLIEFETEGWLFPVADGPETESSSRIIIPVPTKAAQDKVLPAGPEAARTGKTTNRETSREQIQQFNKSGASSELVEYFGRHGNPTLTAIPLRGPSGDISAVLNIQWHGIDDVNEIAPHQEVVSTLFKPHLKFLELTLQQCYTYPVE